MPDQPNHLSPDENGRDKVRAELATLIRSDSFIRSPRLSQFLTFVVEETLAGRGDGLKEYVVGTTVFGKAVDYDPKIDSTVRTEASKLRAKLRQHYSLPGVASGVVISVPKGGYAAEFDYRNHFPMAAALQEDRARPRIKIYWLAAVTLSIVMASAAVWYLRKPKNLPSVKVCVLPFTEIPASKETYMADGLTADFTRGLVPVHGIEVVARSSAQSFRDPNTSLQAIGTKLNADVVVRGAIQHVGDRIRLTITAVPVAGGPAWDETQERPAAALSAMRDNAIQHFLGSALVRDHITRNQTARFPGATEEGKLYDLYLRGRSATNTQDQLAYFERALAINPRYAPALAGMAEVYLTRAQRSLDPIRNDLGRSKEYAEKALAADPQWADAHAILAMVLIGLERDWGGARNRFQRALEIDPDSDYTGELYGRMLSETGRHAEAITRCRRALARDPVSISYQIGLGWVNVNARHFEDAIDQLKGLIHSHPDSFAGHYWLAKAYLGKHQPAQAVEQIEAAAQLSRDPLAAAGLLAIAYASNGQHRDAQRLSAQVDDLGRTRFVGRLKRVQIALALGSKETALDILEEAFRDGDFLSLSGLQVDSTLDPLREEPRFLAIVQGMRFPASR